MFTVIQKDEREEVGEEMEDRPSTGAVHVVKSSETCFESVPHD